MHLGTSSTDALYLSSAVHALTTWSHAMAAVWLPSWAIICLISHNLSSGVHLVPVGLQNQQNSWRRWLRHAAAGSVWGGPAAGTSHTTRYLSGAAVVWTVLWHLGKGLCRGLEQPDRKLTQLTLIRGGKLWAGGWRPSHTACAWG